MREEFRNVALVVTLVLLVFGSVLTANEKGLSHVRVVRLSFVDGSVLVKRPGSTEWAKALVNTPIEEGYSLSTAGNSFAEVEFENGSTARLGQLSRLDFQELALTANGGRINHLVLDTGYSTFHITPQRGDVYTLQAAKVTVTPRGKSEFRIDLSQGRLRVEDFQGPVEVSGPAGDAKLTKDKTLECEAGTQTAYNITHGIQKDAWDNWVAQRDEQAELAFRDQPIGINSAVYGWNDLDAYGEWAYFPGFGYGWSPFVAAGWSPYSMGMWSWYPSLGYTWISAEPWGWLPFHTGLWSYLPGFGYFWMPGNLYMWSPALVTWYSGPGYIGWAPLARGGGTACPGTSCVTAVQTGTLQSGVLIDQNTRVAVNNLQLSRISAPQVVPDSQAMLSGRPITGNIVFPGMTGALAANLNSSRALSSAAAPDFILMGQKPLAGTSGSFFSRSSRRPFQVRMGNTLGGHYAASGLSMEPHSMGRSGPEFLSHRSVTGFSQPAPRMEGGTIRAPSGGSERMSEPRAFQNASPAGSFHSAPSAPPPSAPASGDHR